jgi:phosphoglucosamine mutase
VWDEVRRVESELGSDGRVLVRPSGTEAVVRVMVEATTEHAARSAAERIAKAVRETLG